MEDDYVTEVSHSYSFGRYWFWYFPVLASSSMSPSSSPSASVSPQLVHRLSIEEGPATFLQRGSAVVLSTNQTKRSINAFGITVYDLLRAVQNTE
jgi:hypothetical protein